MLLSFWTLTKQKLKCALIKILKAKVHSVIFERVQRMNRGVVFFISGGHLSVSFSLSALICEVFFVCPGRLFFRGAARRSSLDWLQWV